MGLLIQGDPECSVNVQPRAALLESSSRGELTECSGSAEACGVRTVWTEAKDSCELVRGLYPELVLNAIILSEFH